ncbi:MAG: hypothetical protein GX614_10705 [Sandaracinaceae bacterium]|nr:hypothetical protein [Sandaracinaceae bacterium]
MVTPWVESAPLAILVVEEGGLIGDRAERMRRGGRALHVLRQNRDEDPESFARRCRAKLRELEDEGARIDEAALIGGGVRRRARTLSRAALLRALLGPMVRRGEGRLILTGREADRRVMESLAEIVGAQIADGIEIYADFDEPSKAERTSDDRARMARP